MFKLKANTATESDYIIQAALDLKEYHKKMVYGIGAFIAYALFSAFLLVPGKNIVGSP